MPAGRRRFAGGGKQPALRPGSAVSAVRIQIRQRQTGRVRHRTGRRGVRRRAVAMQLGGNLVRQPDPGAAGAQVRRHQLGDERDRTAASGDRLHRRHLSGAEPPDRQGRQRPAAGRQIAGGQTRGRAARIDSGDLRQNPLGAGGRGRGVLSGSEPGLPRSGGRSARRHAGDGAVGAKRLPVAAGRQRLRLRRRGGARRQNPR
ncbi:Uncharacterised protein [Serratia marcescens]|nr:Uncharacterised protein [Serratia marcescens]